MNIYYSRSNDVQDHLLNAALGDFIKNLPISVDNLSKHDRSSSYNPQLLKNADLVVVGITSFDAIIGKGCYTEIETAYKLGIPVVYLVCRDSDDEPVIVTHPRSPKIYVHTNEDDWREYCRLDNYIWLEHFSDETPTYYNEMDDVNVEREYTFYPDDQGDVELYFEAHIRPKIKEKDKSSSIPERPSIIVSKDSGLDQNLLLLG